jgi:uncharacterized protein (UPF0276 family)
MIAGELVAVQSRKKANLFPYLGFGLGLRSEHYEIATEGRAEVSWFEVVSENYMRDGGRPLAILEKVREHYPLFFHGVSLSLGSADSLDLDYLKKLKKLIRNFQPALVSDHCCWTRVEGENLHDLMPLPFTQEAVNLLVEKVQQVQDYLGRRIAIENVSSYLTYRHSEMTEWEFLKEVSEKSDCGLLLDVNNVYVSSVNHSFDPMTYIKGIPSERVAQIHLAGHSVQFTEAGQRYLIDTHDAPVCEEVWSLYEKTVFHLGLVSTMVERDAEIPEYSVLEAEMKRARQICQGVLNAKAKLERASKGVSNRGPAGLAKRKPRSSVPFIY